MIRHGQAPHSKPLLVGSGHVARHFSFYFENLGLDFAAWNRREPVTLRDRLAGADRVWLAVSDSALPALIDGELRDFPGTIVHFSGAFNHPRAIGAHPLMTFGPALYEPAFYPRIHFTVSGGTLDEALPGLKNPWSPIMSAERARYHALCVLGGNFPVLLWNKMEKDLAALGVPSEAARSYLLQVARNYASLGEKALTGPLVRKDAITIEKNLAALAGDPWQEVYKSFLEAVK